MKDRVLGVVVIVLGALLILTPWVIFPVCMVGRNAPPKGLEVGHHMRHGCHDTLRAETALGVVAIGIGAVPLLWPRRKIKIAVSTATLIVAALVVLFPLKITGLCKMSDMACRIGTMPALATVAVVMGLAGLIGLIVSIRAPD